MRILQLRGTNGSGKSTAVRRLLRAARGAPICAVGRYPDTGVGGGCDTIHTQEEICVAVRESAASGRHVVYEGVVASTIFQRYRDLSLELSGAGHRAAVAFLQPPLEVCLGRVLSRRRARGVPDTEPFREEQVRAKWELNARLLIRFREAGVETLELDDHEPLTQLADFFDIAVSAADLLWTPRAEPEIRQGLLF